MSSMFTIPLYTIREYIYITIKSYTLKKGRILFPLSSLPNQIPWWCQYPLIILPITNASSAIP